MYTSGISLFPVHLMDEYNHVHVKYIINCRNVSQDGVYFCINQVSGTEMSKWLNELCPIILDMLQDASLIAKREVTNIVHVNVTKKIYHQVKELNEIQDSVKTV